MFLFCSELQYILLWLKIDYKGLPVFMYAQFFYSRACVHARHIILMVLHVLYQVIISNEIYLMFDALCDDCLPRSFCCFFSFYAHFVLFSFF